MDSESRSNVPAAQPEGWRIAAVAASVSGFGCLLLLVPSVVAVFDAAQGLGAGGMFALPVIPLAPLGAAAALVAGAVGVGRRDVVVMAFAGAGLVSSALAMTVVAVLGGYGVLAYLWDAVVTAASRP
ncbi:hypothetical protein [Microbacterium thalli]|uniref:Uncharacterized protein n=1 Tax=Microbacterium thalli TaxID=3027921 RepID=A0ABT5SHX3_9MICO|nr:hypothetical protein [Microbacterium thalli]MDD7962429.1 hypothetical protein [Microbacterium thalli]